MKAALALLVLTGTVMGSFMYWEANRTNKYGCPVYGEDTHQCVVNAIKSK